MLLYVLFCCLVVACRGASYAGTVKDAETNLPLGAVQVVVTGSGTRFETFTNVYGSYTVTLNAPNAVVTMVYTNAAYYSRTITVTFPAADSFSNDVAMTPVPDFTPSYLRVELTWGGDPRDLDLRIITPCGSITGSKRTKVERSYLY
jgi:hypothetical protein